ncbi:MAG: hypothetical protein Q3W93_10960, partial [Eubacterium sp.]|nr:hypothetical protein [Eubacterium sp.]
DKTSRSFMLPTFQTGQPIMPYLFVLFKQTVQSSVAEYYLTASHRVLDFIISRWKYINIS